MKLQGISTVRFFEGYWYWRQRGYGGICFDRSQRV